MAIIRRRAGIASVATLAGITLTFGVAHAFAPQWANTVGLDIWNISSLNSDRNEEASRQDQLECVQEQLNRQIAAADDIAMLLIADRITLRKAVSELEEITRSRVGFGAILAANHREAPTHEARLALYAIQKVRFHLEQNPSRLEAVVSRLQCQYAADYNNPAQTH